MVPLSIISTAGGVNLDDLGVENEAEDRTLEAGIQMGWGSSRLFSMVTTSDWGARRTIADADQMRRWRPWPAWPWLDLPNRLLLDMSACIPTRDSLLPQSRGLKRTIISEHGRRLCGRFGEIRNQLFGYWSGFVLVSSHGMRQADRQFKVAPLIHRTEVSYAQRVRCFNLTWVRSRLSQASCSTVGTGWDCADLDWSNSATGKRRGFGGAFQIRSRHNRQYDGTRE